MVLSELRHCYCAYPSFLTLGLGVLICEPPWEVVAVHHPPILAEHDWQGVGLGTPPHYPSANCFHTPNGVNYTSADQVDMLLSASLLLHKGVTSPWGVANRKSQLQWVTFTLPLESLISYKGTPFVTWHITLYSYFAPMVFHLPFPLKHISLLQHYVSRYQLNCASSFIIVVLLSVHFTVGLVLGFSISFFEALSHLFHLGRDSTATCISTNCGEEKSMGRWVCLPNI